MIQNNMEKKHNIVISLNHKLNCTLIVISNRVPKCGSTLTRQVMKYLSVTTRKFTCENSSNHNQRRLTVQQQINLQKELVKKAKKAYHQKFVYDRHFYFVNFTEEPDVVFYYINQLRDPLNQLVSAYYYHRYICVMRSSNKRCQTYPPSIFNLTLDDCISTGDPKRCSTETYGASDYLSYFCGQSSICNSALAGYNGEAALALSKKNIEQHYIYIGLLEYIESSYEILERLLPDLFTGIVRIYHEKKNEPRITATPSDYQHPPSNKTLDILRQVLKDEYELYNFVRQRFFQQYYQLFHRTLSI